MAILFLFTISCSLTSVVLAALSADVGGSFSIVYEAPRGKAYLKKEDFMNVKDEIGDFYQGDRIYFEYSDSFNMEDFLQNSFESGHIMTTDSGISIDYATSPGGGNYYVFILSNDDIYLPEDSSNFFDGAFSVKLDVYMNNLHTENVKISDRMFAGVGCELNLIDMNFSNVTSAKGMFENCTAERVFISESILTNEKINNKTDNPNLYNSTHDESGQFHMTAGEWKDGSVDESNASQFVLPAIDLSLFCDQLKNKAFNLFGVFYLSQEASMVGFDHYTSPGNYTTEDGETVINNYSYNSASYLGTVFDFATFEGVSWISWVAERIKIFVILGITTNPFAIFVLSDEPIYIINAPNPEDEFGGLLDAFEMKDDPDFKYLFNNFDTRFWG